MSSLAGLFKSAGFTVSGSDQNIYPPTSDVLKELGVRLFQGYNLENLNCSPDLVVIGNAVPKDNPEVEDVLKRNVSYTSFPQALAEFFLKDKIPLVVTGTHGKTTTTSLLAWILESAGEDPGFMIGGIPKNFKQNYKFGKGEYFVVEGDEYDTAFFDTGPKFWHYRPQGAIITSIEYDHADIYKDLQAIKEVFRKFAELLPTKGILITAHEDVNIREIINEDKLSCRVETYGLDVDADWSAREVNFLPRGVSFKVYFRDKFVSEFSSRLLGVHNLKNALAVIALTYKIGIPVNKIKKGLETFQGVKRRQEVIAEINNILIMDDFAHHPTAIRETLKALRAHYSNYRIWAIFEPRSASSRRNIFQKDFVDAFDPADKVIIANLYAPEKILVEERLDVNKLVTDIAKAGKNVRFIAKVDEIVETITPELRPNDLVCIMSSGSFDRLHEKIRSKLKSLQKKNPL